MKGTLTLTYSWKSDDKEPEIDPKHEVVLYNNAEFQIIREFSNGKTNGTIRVYDVGKRTYKCTWSIIRNITYAD
jgi:hypothetical protein